MLRVGYARVRDEYARVRVESARARVGVESVRFRVQCGRLRVASVRFGVEAKVAVEVADHACLRYIHRMSEPDPAAPEHTCIVLRLRRTVQEDAYVAVPISDAILKTEPDGSRRIDFDRFVAEAIRLSADPAVEWRVEGPASVETNPIQQPIPPGRTVFDIHTLEVLPAPR